MKNSVQNQHLVMVSGHSNKVETPSTTSSSSSPSPPTSALPSAQNKNQLTRTRVEGDSDDEEAPDGSILRYLVASLGLLCAIVSCYAQVVFCIAIVEMVIPSPEGGESGSTISATGTIIINDPTCPIDENYRSFYDDWRFPLSDSQQYHQNQSTISPLAGISKMPPLYEDRFKWDAGQQGILLGAAAIGAAPLQVLGGRMAEIYGAKWVLFLAGFGTAITNFLIPHIAHYSYFLLIIIRIIMGISQSGMEPALMCLFAEWLAPAETSFFISMLLFAICIGCFLGSLCSGYLLTLGLGWPITYYVAAGISFVWSILWLMFATSKPHHHRFISRHELAYILAKQHRRDRSAMLEGHFPVAVDRRSSTMITCLLTNGTMAPVTPVTATTAAAANVTGSLIVSANDEFTSSEGVSPHKKSSVSSRLQVPTKVPPDGIQNKKRVEGASSKKTSSSAPWYNILTTRQVWVFVVTKISVRWCADVITIELPTYLANVLHLSIKLNGLLNSISAALFALFSFISGCMANRLLKSRPGGLTKTNIRKIIQAMASFGGAIGLFLMTTYDCNLVITITMLMFLSCCLVFGTGGELQIPFDMTSDYTGTLHGLACTLSVSGWLAPPLVGLVLGDQPNSRARWSIVWYSTAFISFIGGLVFVLFADARPIDFDSPRPHTKSPSRIKRKQPSHIIIRNDRSTLMNEQQQPELQHQNKETNSQVLMEKVDREEQEQPTNFLDDHHHDEDKRKRITGSNDDGGVYLNEAADDLTITITHL